MSSRILITGLSHRTAPVEARERLAVVESELPKLLAQLRGLDGIEECVLLSTCNRVEVVLSGDEPRVMQRSLLAFLESERGLSRAWLERYSFTCTDAEAIRHVFRVSSSLDSLIVGEPQILGQTKQAYRASQDAGATGPILSRLFEHAIRTAKRVRSETRIAENAVSVSFAAVELARKVFGRLDGKRVLVIGAGKMGALAVKHLRAAGSTHLEVVNRSFERAQAMADELGGAPFPMSALDDCLIRADIVISSTGSQDPIITAARMAPIVERRRFRPLFLIDIAVPRDIDPACSGLSNIYLFDVDDLGKVVEENMGARMREADRAERIIDDEVETMRRWLSEHEVVPTIVSLRQKLIRLKELELERMLRANPDLDPAAIAAAERMAHGLIRKVLHEPTLSLRQASTLAEKAPLVGAVRDLFNLEDSESVDEAEAEHDETLERDDDTWPIPGEKLH